MHEIGGFLELEHFYRGEYHTGLKLNCVRNAIALTMYEYGYQHLWIPFYLCDSVKNALKKFGFQYSYYSINEQFIPLLNHVCSESEAVLIVNFFGQLNPGNLSLLKEKYKNIIVDNTHAFFTSPVPGLDTVYTCRKFFGVPDGAYLYLNAPSKLYDSLCTDYSSNRMEHLLGRFESSASQYYSVFSVNDHSLSNEPIKKMSSITSNILNAIDYTAVQKRRQNNFDYLNNILSPFNLLNIKNSAGLYMYPLLLRNSAWIRARLIEEKIYIPTLWPNVLEECEKNTLEYNFANNLLLLPIDQRYSDDDMHYIFKYLKRLLMEGMHEY